MRQSKSRPRSLRKIPTIDQTPESDWLGAEAHVRAQGRPRDWFKPFRTTQQGYNALALGVALMGGALLGGLLISLLERKR